MSPSTDRDFLDLSSLLARRRGLTDFFRQIQDHVARRVGVSNLFVALLEDETHISFPVVSDESEEILELGLFPLDGLTAEVIATGRRLWTGEVPDLFEKHRFLGPRATEWLGIPLIDREGRALGAFVVQSYTPGFRFDAADLVYLESVALHVGLALQLHAFERERAVRSIAALVEETTDLESLYPGIQRIVSGLLPPAAESFIVARLDEARGLFRPEYVVDTRETLAGGAWPVGQGLSSYVVGGGGRPFIYEEGITPLPEGYVVRGEEPVYWLGVPLRIDTVMLGVVIIQTYDRASPLSRDDLRSLEEIAPSISLAIAKTELLRHGSHR